MICIGNLLLLLRIYSPFKIGILVFILKSGLVVSFVGGQLQHLVIYTEVKNFQVMEIKYYMTNTSYFFKIEFL